MGIKQKEKLGFQTAKNGNAVDDNTKVKNHEIVRAKIGAEAELSFIEKFVYFCVYSYFLATAVYKIFSFPLGKLYLFIVVYIYSREPCYRNQCQITKIVT